MLYLLYMYFASNHDKMWGICNFLLFTHQMIFNFTTLYNLYIILFNEFLKICPNFVWPKISYRIF